MKTFLALLILICHGCAAPSGSRAPSLIGDWVAEVPDGVGIIIFEPDGTGGWGGFGTPPLGLPFTYELKDQTALIRAWPMGGEPGEFDAVLRDNRLHVHTPRGDYVFEKIDTPRQRRLANQLRKVMEEWKSE